MRVLKFLGAILGLLIAVVVGVFVVARFSDGPLAMFPGGPLESGTFVSSPVTDWEFARDVEEIELQLEGEDSSRTTWIVVVDGNAYIPCSLSFPPGKRWHQRADRDGRAILRIDGRKYPVQLRRQPDASEQEDLKASLQAKYAALPPTDAGVWFFAIEPRTR